MLSEQRFTRRELGKVLAELAERGVEYYIIGDTSIQLSLGEEELSGDVDLFVKNPSPVLDQDFYAQLAAEKGWQISTTEAGTPQIIAYVDHATVVLDLYENYMDIEIPVELLEARAIKYVLGEAQVNAAPPELYIVFKARQGIDLEKLGEHIAKLKGRLNKRLIKEAMEYYPEDEAELIAERLSSLGLEIDL